MPGDACCRPPVDITADRLVQESLTNVVGHASARSVVIWLAYAPAELTVSIVDDGRRENLATAFVRPRTTVTG
jgi:glucose-6-phosphate-specific signal transduction histidine kinase